MSFDHCVQRSLEATDTASRKYWLDQARAADPKRFDAAMKRLLAATYPPLWRRLGGFLLRWARG